MKFITFATLLFIAFSAAANAFPKQLIEQKKEIYFGQNINEVELAFKNKAKQHQSSIARKEIDLIIDSERYNLQFDTGKLQKFVFRHTHEEEIVITAFQEDWRNFPEISGKSLKTKMTKEKVMEYISLWEKRAQRLGAKASDLGDLREKEYRISYDSDPDGCGDFIGFSFGPNRRSTKGGIWSSGVHFVFFSRFGAELWKEKIGTLQQVHVSCNQFNTKGKPRD